MLRKRSDFRLLHKAILGSILVTSLLFTGSVLAQEKLSPGRTVGIFTQGTLHFTCDIRNAVEGEDVACQVAINGIPQEQILSPGEEVDYILDPGSYTITATLIGELAYLWSPAVQEHSVNISVGSTRYLSSRFEKAGHLTITLDQPGVLADFYDNDELIAEQVNAADLWVTPNKLHKLTATNFTDPNAGDLYTWQDATKSIYVGSGQEKSVIFILKQNYLKGFLALTCNISTPQSGEYAYCQPSIDGTAYDPIMPGQTVEYTLEPGRYAVVVEAGPAYTWVNPNLTFSPTITAGKTREQTAAFNLQHPAPGTVEAFTWPILAAISNTPPQYVDDFSNPGSGWQIETRNQGAAGENGVVGYVDGEYFAAVDPPPDVHPCVSGNNYSMPRFSDFVLEIDGRFVSVVSGMHWSVQFRGGDTAYGADVRGQYNLDLTEHRASLNRWINWPDGPQGLMLDQYTGSAIASGLETNHVQIIVKGSQFAAVINGEAVLYGVDPDAVNFYGGNTFLTVCTSERLPMEARWDNLRIWDISGF